MDIRGIPESIFLSCQFELEIAGKEGNWFDGWMDGCFVSGCLPFVKLSYACRTLAQKKKRRSNSNILAEILITNCDLKRTQKHSEKF